jgi:hypothetical protein
MPPRQSERRLLFNSVPRSLALIYQTIRHYWQGQIRDDWGCSGRIEKIEPKEGKWGVPCRKTLANRPNGGKGSTG